MGSVLDGNIANAQFGSFVALSYNGTRMAIGRPHAGKGDVGVYDFIDGQWELMPPPAGLSSTLTLPGKNSGDLFGSSVARVRATCASALLVARAYQHPEKVHALVT